MNLTSAVSCTSSVFLFFSFNAILAMHGKKSVFFNNSPYLYTKEQCSAHYFYNFGGAFSGCDLRKCGFMVRVCHY